LWLAVSVALLAVSAFPFARDAYTRAHLMHSLDPVLSERDRDAFREWNGDPVSFVKSLNARCELIHGQGAAACAPYRLAQE
jgi:hypothetical protein